MSESERQAIKRFQALRGPTLRVAHLVPRDGADDYYILDDGGPQLLGQHYATRADAEAAWERERQGCAQRVT